MISYDQHTVIGSPDGTWYTGFGDLFGDVDDLSVGDEVRAMMVEDDTIAEATVTAIDYDKRLIYFKIDQDSYRTDLF